MKHTKCLECGMEYGCEEEDGWCEECKEKIETEEKEYYKKQKEVK